MSLNHSEIMERYAQVRKDKGLSFRKLADILGISYGVIQNIEHKRVEKVSNTYINLLCDKLNVNREWLLYGEGEMYKNDQDSIAYAEFMGKIARVQDKNIKRLLEKAMKLKEDDLAKFVRMVDVFIEEDEKKEDS